MVKGTEVHEVSHKYALGLILALGGGYLDAYTYIARGGVFANAQTGNIVLLGLSLASMEWIRAVCYIFPIIAFMAGIIICEVVKRNVAKGIVHWKQYIVLLEMITIAVVTFMPKGKVGGINCDMIANIMISFVCSLQVQSFRKIRGIVCATTMCTGNLRSATESLTLFMSSKEKKHLHNAGKFFGIVLFFVLGAVISSFLTNMFSEKSAIFVLLVLGIAFAVMFFKATPHKDGATDAQ